LATDATRAAQAAHLARLKTMGRYPGCTLTTPDNLAKHILSSAILDLLVKAEVVADYGKPEQLKQVTEAAVKGATGPQVDRITEISKTLGVTEDAAKTLLKIVGEDPSIPDDKLAEALTKVAGDYKRLQAQVAALNPDNPTAQALVDEAKPEIDAGHFERAHARAEYLLDQADALYRQGDERGDNAALRGSIEAYQAALEECTRERVSLGRAMIQNNLGNALQALGERESRMARLEEAVAAYRAALAVRQGERHSANMPGPT
jgi:tetratricopeptide (TPR) repeat protein